MLFRSVNQHAGIAQPEKVDLFRGAWRMRDARECAPASEGIDQARLSDIGSANEGDFRKRGFRQSVNTRRPGHKFARARKKLPPVHYHGLVMNLSARLGAAKNVLGGAGGVAFAAVDPLADARGLAAPASQIIELGAPYFALAHDMH